jgi:hypothetical protein
MTLIRVGRTVVALSLALVAALAASPVLASGEPSGERLLGQSAIEPAYDYSTGNLTYLLTPTRSPFPTHTSSHAVAPLYLVLYPPGSAVLSQHNLNCMGVPGNCPDHDGLVAGLGTTVMPGVYGTNPAAVPGHDHLVGLAATKGDFNVAWEVVEVLFTNKPAADQHITTWTQLDAALTSGNAIKIDLGFAFHCSAVAASTYMAGTPI